MPQLPFDFTFNIDENSANRVEKKIADIDNAVSNIGTKAGSKSGASSAVSINESTVKSFQRLGRATKKYADDHADSMRQATASTLGLGNNVEKTSQVISKDLTKGATLSNNQIEELDQTITSLNDNLNNTRVGVGHTSSGLKNLQIDARNLNKSTANANQTLFAFSDLVQDSTQFTQGFSQGMRAIGNNVAFTAELFSNLKNRVDVYNESIIATGGSQKDLISVSGQLRKSLRGFGGVLIAINAAFVVGQIFADRHRRAMKKLEEQAKATAEGVSEVAREFAKAMSGDVPDPFGLRARQVELDLLQSQLEGFDEEVAKKGILNKATAQFKEDIEEARQAVQDFMDIEAHDMELFFKEGLPNAFGAVGRGTRDVIVGISQFFKEFKKFNDQRYEEMLADRTPEEIAEVEEAIRKAKEENAEFYRQSLEASGLAEASERLKEYGDDINEFLADPLGNVINRFPTASYEMAKFFGLLKESDIVEFEALRELRIELTKTQAQQDAYNKLLQQDGFEGLLAYTERLKDLATATTLYNSELYLLNEGQLEFAGILTNQTKSTTEAIGALKELADEQLRIYQNTKLSKEERERAYQVLQLLIPTLRDYQDALKRARMEVEEITFKHTAFLSEIDKIEFTTDKQIKALEDLKKQFPDLADEVENAIKTVKEFGELQKTTSKFDNISELAKAAGQFGEIFNASKEFRLAMATIDGAAAIVSVLADPTLGLTAKIAGAASIAAATAAQIQQIRNTELGSSSAPTTSNYGVGANTRFLPTPNNQEDTESFRAFGESLNFMPQSSSMFGEDKIVIEQNIKGKDLALVVRAGNKELKSSQVVV